MQKVCGGIHAEVKDKLVKGSSIENCENRRYKMAAGFYNILLLLFITLVASKPLVNHEDPTSNPTENEATINQRVHPEGVRFGDVKITEEQEEFFGGKRNGRSRRGLVQYESWKWPNGEVNVEIAPDFSSQNVALIKSKLDEIKEASCIKFNILNSGHNVQSYVHVVRGTGCWSYVGRTGRRQELSLDTGCLHGRIITHEFLHALGVFHEQSRPDRNNYIRVNYDNIQTNAVTNFDIVPYINSLGVPYDLLSIMHYGEKYFTKNGEKTIEALDSTFDGAKLASGTKMTASDKLQLNLFYGCATTTTTAAPPTTTTPKATTTTTTTLTTTPTITTTTPTTTTTTTTTTSTTPITTTASPTTTTTTPTTTTTKPKTTTTTPTTTPKTTSTTTSTTPTTTTTIPTTTPKTTSTTTTTTPTTTTTTPTTTPKTTSTTTTTTTTTTPTTTSTTTTVTTETPTTAPATTTTTTPSQGCQNTESWCFPHLSTSYCGHQIFASACPGLCNPSC